MKLLRFHKPLRSIVLFGWSVWLCGFWGSLRATDRADTIRFELISGKIVIPVRVDGVEGRFLFDTGASLCCVTEAFSRRLSLQKRGSVRVRDSGETTARLDKAVIGEFGLGSRSFTRTKVLIYDPAEWIECLEIDGIVGANLLRKSVVTLSLADSVLILRDQLPGEMPEGTTSSRVRMIRRLPYIDVRVSGGGKTRSERTLLDTGAGDYRASRRFFRRLATAGLLREQAQSEGQGSYGFHGASPATRNGRAVVERLGFCGTGIDNVPVFAASRSALLGIFILRFGDLTIDYPGKKVHYTSRSEPMRLQGYSFPAFTAVYVDGMFQIGTVWDESLAGRISPGDRILSIGGRPAEEIDPCAFLTGAWTPEPDSVYLIEGAGGARISVVRTVTTY